MRALLSMVFLLLAACQTPMRLPAEFVRVPGGDDVRAVTGDDGQLWLRHFPEGAEVDLPFCVTSVRRDFVDQRGYELIGEGDVADVGGQPGHWFEFRTALRGRRHGYLVAVWVRPKGLLKPTYVQTCEFVAPEEVFVKRLPKVQEALATVSW